MQFLYKKRRKKCIIINTEIKLHTYISIGVFYGNNN